MKTTKTFENATLRTVNNGYIEIDYNGKTHCFNNASVVSINNGTIIIESEWTPTQGELIKVLNDNIDCYVIFNNIEGSSLFAFGSKEIHGSYYRLDNDRWTISEKTDLCPVTPEEQQAFDNFCKSQGKIWNKEKLQWEKYRWKPITSEWYYFVDHYCPDAVGRHCWANDHMDNRYYDNYNCFQTKEEALEAAKKLKELLKSL